MFFLYIFGVILGLFALYVLFLFICALLINPTKEYRKDSPFYRFLLQSASAMLLRFLRIRIHVTGLEQVPKEEKLLFTGNHLSNFDPIVTWHVFRPWKLAYISKPENFKIPFFGRFIRKCCFLPIDRQNPRNAIVTIRKAAELLESREVSVGVYPEGTRSKDGTLLSFHNGVFKIAQKAGASIVVLSIAGTQQIHSRTPWRRTEVYLDVLQVIPAQRVAQSRTEQLGAHIRQLLDKKQEERKA